MSFSGVQSASGTLVANTAQAITFGTGTFPIRYAYVLIENTAATGTIFARTDGTAATVGGDNCFEIGPGSSALVANGFASWTQAANVIPAGTYLGFTPGLGTPQVNNPYGSSPYGGKASPGTSVSLISSGTPTFTVTGTG